MNSYLKKIVLDVSGADQIVSTEPVQSLWSGYGEIIRVAPDGGAFKSLILKHIALPEQVRHPRGWSTDLSHARKLKSYEVEMSWYRGWRDRCDAHCRGARCYGVFSARQGDVIVLEDLDGAGFPRRMSELTPAEAEVCLGWLAEFHAEFMGETADGLWPVGTYWHLETRPDEWAAMEEGPLKASAALIDKRLNECRYLTLVHGDAKVANFCFSPDLSAVAAVDFQYVGGGCGMKDVAYFLGSCLSEQMCERYQEVLLDHYFSALRQALKRRQKGIDADAVEAEWRELFAYAWTDFFRFLMGWMPGHRKVNDYSRRLAHQVIQELPPI